MMRRARSGLALATAAVVLGAAAPAADPADHPPWAKPYAGAWTLAGVSEGDPVCEIVLGTGLAIGGAAIEVSATCRRNYPLEDVAGWALDGKAIRFIDPMRRTVATFRPLPDGSYGADFPGDRTVSLERGPPPKPASLRALFDEAGTFTLSGPDNAGACGFAVTARTATSGRLEQAGRCPAPWKGRGWANWSFEGGKLLLKDAKGVPLLTMTGADAYTFVAELPSGPIFFGPGVIDGSEMLETP